MLLIALFQSLKRLNLASEKQAYPFLVLMRLDAIFVDDFDGARYLGLYVDT